MAKVLKDYEFVGLANGRYPWNQWFDGQIWQLERGKDYQIGDYSFRAAAKGAAKRHHGKVKTSSREDGVTVIQFIQDGTP